MTAAEVGQGERTEWDRLCASFEMARADAAECGESDTETNFYDGAFWKAWHTLLLAPAPDAAGLVRKLEMIRDQQAWEERDWPALLNTAIEDARRVAGA